MPDSLLPQSGTEASKAESGRRPARRWPWFLLAAVVLAGGAAAWFRPPAPAPAAPPAAAAPRPVLTVTTTAAQLRRVVRRIPVDGPVAAWQELRLGMEINGLRVVEVAVEEGDSVEAGQVLARLDDAVPVAQLEKAEAAITEAEATLTLANAELRRVQSLIASNNAPRQTLEQRQAELARAEARLVSLRAARNESAVQVERTRIVAPDAGVILSREILAGSVSAAGQVAFRLLRQGRIEMQARVQEMDLANVRPGQKVAVRHGTRRVEGEVRAIAPVLAGTTRLGIVHVTLPRDSGLLPGMFVLGTIDAGTAEMLAVPQEAVVFRGGAPHVFVPEGDRVAARRVTVGMRLEDGSLAIEEGLSAGETVVATGAGFLADGDRVRVAGER